MKKIIVYIISLWIITCTSCTDQFTELNKNPNAPVEVLPELLFRKVLYDQADQMSLEAFVAGNTLSQYFTSIDFNLFDRHGLATPQYGGNPWNFLYENLRDTEIILEKSRANAAFAVYEGPALIYKAYLTMLLTDLYGDVPYSEALRGKSGIIAPAYDTQEAIYTGDKGILANLKQGISLINNYKGSQRLQGDILYNGQLAKWVKLGNSLQLKAYMRISNQRDVRAEIQKLVADNQFITQATDNAIFNFTATQPTNFKMSTARIGDFNLYIMSETMEEILRRYQDPRMQVFFRPTAANNQVYRGLRNGPDASTLSISVSNYSFAGTIFREDAGRLKANFMTSFEVNFLLAEAAEKGWITGNAQTYYEQGVKDAFQFWNTSLPSDYLTTGTAAFSKENTSKRIEQIITQKWIANILNGYEGWIEFRRTGFPALKPVTASLNQGLFPVRMPYPATESALNNVNYRVAADKTNNNSINSPVWWDK